MVNFHEISLNFPPSQWNKMHSSNLTIVFAPNTLYCRDRDDAIKSITDMQRVSLVFKSFIDYCTVIFDYLNEPEDDVLNQMFMSEFQLNFEYDYQYYEENAENEQQNYEYAEYVEEQ